MERRSQGREMRSGPEGGNRTGGNLRIAPAATCLACSLAAMAACVPVSALAQEDAFATLPCLGMMWTETSPHGPYSNDAEIRERISSSSRPARFAPAISIPSKTFNEYYKFFEQNKDNVVSLRIFGATNDDIKRLSGLESLIFLALPDCRADNFRPLTKLKNLQELRVANPNLEQFKEDRVLANMPSLSNLTLYNVADLQATLNLPGLEPRTSLDERDAKGIFSLRIYAPAWNPRHRIDWPEKLRKLPNFGVMTNRIWFAYLQGKRAEITISRSAQDNPTSGSTLLKDLIEQSGFYDDRTVNTVDLKSEFRRQPQRGYQPIVTHDRTDISPLRAFPELKYLNLEGDFYGFECLRDVPLESVHYLMRSPSPSDQTVEVLSNHPTLQRIRKNIESATDRVMWERER